METAEEIPKSKLDLIHRISKEINLYGSRSDSLKAKILNKYSVESLYALSEEQAKETLTTLNEYKENIKSLRDLLSFMLANLHYEDCDYDNDNFKRVTSCLSSEPEGGKRCGVCFGLRLKYTALMAKRCQFDYFGTTLTVSPHKNSDIINKIGEKVGENIGVKFLYSDFKKNEGYKKSIMLSKEFDLYRQEYCGCRYSIDELKERKH